MSDREILDAEALLATLLPDVESTYGERDTILYALGVGYGQDPTDERQLAFVYESGLKLAPTFACALGWRSHWIPAIGFGLDFHKVVHGEERLQRLAPLPAAATVVGRTRIVDFIDKGVDKGAVLVVRRDLFDKESGTHYASVEQTLVCRGDGGRGGRRAAIQNAPEWPARPADHICELMTFPNQGLIYRLSGDFNELHVRNDVARAVGFRQPVLHGLATLGLAAHAILREMCDYDPDLFREVSVRFSAPVYPGETVRTEMWRTDDEVLFRSYCVERGSLVLDRGRVIIGPF